MEVKIIIRTPKGQAKGMEWKLRKVLLGKIKPKEMYVSKDDNELVWVVDAPSRRVTKIIRNVSFFDVTIRNIFENKALKKTLWKKLSAKDLKELEGMLKQQTEVEVIKNATAEEIVDEGKTWWQRLKEKFQKVDV
jgi:hypothetical protein